MRAGPRRRSSCLVRVRVRVRIRVRVRVRVRDAHRAERRGAPPREGQLVWRAAALRVKVDTAHLARVRVRVDTAHRRREQVHERRGGGGGLREDGRLGWG
eukprot:scaffold26453_cov56-Phaeocystis_antarctica.AAC.2